MAERRTPFTGAIVVLVVALLVAGGSAPVSAQSAGADAPGQICDAPPAGVPPAEGPAPALGDDPFTVWFTSDRIDLQDPTCTYTQDFYCSSFAPAGQVNPYPYLVLEDGSVAYRNLSSSGVTVSENPFATDFTQGKLAVYVTSLHLSGDYAAQVQMACTASFRDGPTITPGLVGSAPDGTGATIGAWMNVKDSPDSGDTVYYWAEYGTGAGQYPTHSASQQLSLSGHGQGSVVPVFVTLDGLQPDTVYHFRLAACLNCDTGSGYPSYSGADRTLTTAGAAVPVAGGPYLVKSAASGLVVSDPGNSPNWGVQLTQTPPTGPTGAASQQWRLVAGAKGDGYFKLTSVNYGLCVDVFGAYTADGTAVQQYKCDPNAPDQPNQLWKPVLQPDGSYALVSALDPNTSRVLSVKGDSTGADAVLELRADQGTPGQRWTFRAVPGS
jgi:hypothetical protein